MHLITLALDTEHRTSISWVRELSAEEDEVLRRATAELSEWFRGGDLIRIVRDNQEDVDEFGHELLERAQSGRYLPEELRHDTREINRRLVNYLTSMRLFLDHTQARVTRRYGAGSEQLATFKRLSSSSFDECPQYRIVYKLRNYVQHCGMPIEVATISSGIGAEPGGPPVHTLIVASNVETLISSYDSWGAAKPDLLAYGERMDPRALLPVVTDRLASISDGITAAERGSLLTAGRTVLRLLRDGFASGGTGWFADWDEFEGGLHLHLFNPPWEALMVLGLVSAESGPAPTFTLLGDV